MIEIKMRMYREVKTEAISEALGLILDGYVTERELLLACLSRMTPDDIYAIVAETAHPSREDN